MKLAEVCVRRPVFGVMLISFLVTLGIFSYRELGVDLFPRAEPATVSVYVTLPGASPEEIVASVVLPLEDAISTVSGLDEVNVWAFEGTARIICTFVLERNIEGAAQDIREKVAGADEPARAHRDCRQAGAPGSADHPGGGRNQPQWGPAPRNPPLDQWRAA